MFVHAYGQWEFVCFETGSLVAQPAFEFIMEPTLALNSLWSPSWLWAHYGAQVGLELLLPLSLPLSGSYLKESSYMHTISTHVSSLFKQFSRRQPPRLSVPRGLLFLAVCCSCAVSVVLNLSFIMGLCDPWLPPTSGQDTTAGWKSSLGLADCGGSHRTIDGSFLWPLFFSLYHFGGIFSSDQSMKTSIPALEAK